MGTKEDFTPTGLKIEGSYENDRNSENRELYSAMIREAYGLKDVICGHHLVYMAEDKRPDGFVYQVVQEVPSADALIFDHAVMKKLFGAQYIGIMSNLATLPVEGGLRDAYLKGLYFGRAKRDFIAATEAA